MHAFLASSQISVLWKELNKRAHSCGRRLSLSLQSWQGADKTHLCIFYCESAHACRLSSVTDALAPVTVALISFISIHTAYHMHCICAVIFPTRTYVLRLWPSLIRWRAMINDFCWLIVCVHFPSREYSKLMNMYGSVNTWAREQLVSGLVFLVCGLSFFKW